jgi:cytosine/creatinine deaminase
MPILERVLVPTQLLGDSGWPTVASDPTGLVLFDIEYTAQQIVSMQPAFGDPSGLVISPTVDIHTHIDKAFVIDEVGAANGNLFAAIDRMRESHERSTSQEIEQRMQSSLHLAYQAGTRAMRTHLDWPTADCPRSVAVFQSKREEWLGRIDLQGVSLTALDILANPIVGDQIASQVEQAGLILGCFIYRNTDLTRKLQAVFELAKRYRLALDFHVDEGLDDDAVGLWAIASLKSVNQFDGSVVCSHACSLSVQDDQQAIDTLRACVDSGVELVSLPTTNLYLQGDWQGTPIERGITRIKEARFVGLHPCIASDNVQDAFYPYGDYDLMATFSLGLLAAHLSPIHRWFDTITLNPARIMGLSWDGLIAPGSPADFLVFAAKRSGDLMTDAGRRRTVIRRGVAL